MTPQNTYSATASASARNIRAICDLEHSALAKRSFGERWADKVASIAGRVWFAIAHVFLFLGWIIINVGIIRAAAPFDPYPFPLLTLATSLESIFLSLFILTSQNRATAQADQRAHLDLQINLLAEAEATATLRMLRALCVHHGLKIADEAEVELLAQSTEPEALVRDLKTQLPEGP
ncbi:MAG: hypothetical protein JWO19_3918 [Bryobacterales bacterium]|nr:hypothetical protein [Bryobacterales bacterium]